MLRKQIDKLAARVSFLHGREEPPDTPPIQERLAEARLERGLNLEPGPEDDGWHTPPPVQLSDGTRLQLYKDGEAAAAAYRAIEQAKQRVLLEVYIWPSDETGRRFAELLAEKARAGVQVFVIYDGFGSMLADKSIFDPIRRAGGYVLEFHPVAPWRSAWGWRPFNRDHRKILVVDDHLAGVSGLNIGNRYAGNWVVPNVRVDPETMWRDAGVGIVGPPAAIFARAFARTWRYCVRRGPIRRTLHVEGLDITPPSKGPRIGRTHEAYDHLNTSITHPLSSVEDLFLDGAEVGCMGSAPSLSSPLRPFLYQLIHNARKSLSITMAYFAPDDELVQELCNAAKRGVRVRLMLAGRSDVKILILAGRAFYKRLLEAGCEVYEREWAMLHQKSIAVDGCVSVLGSTNLDYRSIDFNLEMTAVIRSREFAAQVEALFDHDVRYATRFNLAEWRMQPLRDQMIQWAVGRLRYLL